MPKNTATAEIKATMCGQTNRRLWPADMGFGSKSASCSLNVKLRLLTAGSRRVLVASLNRVKGDILEIHWSIRAWKRESASLAISGTIMFAAAPAIN